MEGIVAAIIGAVGTIVAAIIATRASRLPHVPSQSSRPPGDPYRPTAEAGVLRPATTRWPVWLVMLLSLFIPGLGSFVLRGKARLAVFIALVAAIPVVFVVLLLFEDAVKQASFLGDRPGLSIFLPTCAAILMVSVALAYKDWKVVALENAESAATADRGRHSGFARQEGVSGAPGG